MEFSNILKLYSPLTIFASQNLKNHKKYYHRSLKEIRYQVKSFLLFNIHVNFLKKLLVQLPLLYLLFFLKLYSVLTMFSPQKHPKICLIIWVFQEYLVRFPTKLLVKLRFGDFQKILRFCSGFTIFAPKNPIKLQKSPQIPLMDATSPKLPCVISSIY